jgi:dihydrofolate reductase
MRLSLIVATNQGHVIGREGDLPWHISADLKRFKSLTMGHHLIMGRKTFDSIGRCLPGRTTIILSRDATYQVEGAIVVDSLEAALQAADGDDEAFIVGGGEIYRLTLPQVDRLHLTLVDAPEVEGDTHFPEVDWQAWQLVEQTDVQDDGQSQYPYSFRVYDRAAVRKEESTT